MTDTSRVDWETAFAPGFDGVVCVLVEGVPVVFTQSGVVPTAVYVTTGSLDPLWHFPVGTILVTRPDASSFSPVLDLLDGDAQWSLYETTKPADGGVEVEALRFDLFDPDGVATELLSSRDAKLARGVASDVPSTGDIPLDSVAGVPSSGYLHIGREAVGYSSLSSLDAVVSGTGAGRGLFGSRARAHVIGGGSRRALAVVNQYPRSLQGRLVTVWLCELWDGVTIVNPALVFCGVAGPGSQIVSNLMRWQLTVDHATKALSRKFDKVPVRIFGYQHIGGFLGTPLSIRFVNTLELGPTNYGGWSPDAGTFIRNMHARGQALALSPTITVNYNSGRAQITSTGPGGDIGWSIDACWWSLSPRSASTENLGEMTTVMPACVMHLDGPLRVGESGQWDLLPSTLAWTATAGGATGRAFAALTCDTDTTKGLFARITARDATTKTLTLLADTRVPFRLGYEPIEREAMSRITKPVTATLAVMAEGDTAVAALCALTVALDELQGSTVAVSAVWWEDIARVFASIPLGGLPEGRSFRFTGDEDSLLSPLINESRLRGAALCVKGGLVSVYRPANFAATEFVRRDIVEGDLVKDAPVEVVNGTELVATAMRFELPDGSTYTYRDVTSTEEYGEGKTIVCTALRAASVAMDATSAAGQLRTIAEQLLGVLGEEQRIVRIFVNPSFWSLDTGDLVTLTHSAVPDWYGNRGVTEALCQVVETRKAFLGGKASVQLALRLAEDSTLAGYAPSALVSNISGPVLTIDTGSAWGSNGFALDVDAAGNAVANQPLQGFAVGDKVVVSEFDDESPFSETFTIVSLTATTATLDGSPDALLVTAAGQPYGCLLSFAPWTDTDVTARQRKYLYIADDADEDLGSGDPPKRWAA